MLSPIETIPTILPKEVSVAYICDQKKSCAEACKCTERLCHLTLDPVHAINKENVDLIVQLIEICKEVENRFHVAYEKDKTIIYLTEKSDDDK